MAMHKANKYFRILIEFPALDGLSYRIRLVFQDLAGAEAPNPGYQVLRVVGAWPCLRKLAHYLLFVDCFSRASVFLHWAPDCRNLWVPCCGMFALD